MEEAANYVQEMRLIQETLIGLIENENNSDIDYQNFNELLTEKQIKSNKNNFKDVLRMISGIERYHHRNPSFLTNIINILEILYNEIISIFNKFEINNIFKKNRKNSFLFPPKIK